MQDPLIGSSDQVSAAWLTQVLTNHGALITGSVTSFEMEVGRGNWSTNTKIKVQYSNHSMGAMPRSLFLKMVNANFEGGSFDSSEVDYYTRDYIGVALAPLVTCYSAVFSEKFHRYHLLLEDVSASHINAELKSPTREYGLALSEGLAVLHAHRWGVQQFSKIGAHMPAAGQIQRFIEISRAGSENLLLSFPSRLEPGWRDAIQTVYAKLPLALLERSKDERGFTLIHGDTGQKNILVPRFGDRPIYIIDRQPFDWALTTWLGTYDLAYAMVLDWDIATRQRLEIPILRNYHDRLIENGVVDYCWEQLFADYQLCVGMCVLVATEYFRGIVDSPWVSSWLLMLQRALTACQDVGLDQHPGLSLGKATSE
jgi:hypothetical protein